MCKPDSGHCLSLSLYQCRCTCSSGNKSLGLCADSHSRKNHGSPGSQITQGILDRDQCSTGAIWQTHLHWGKAPLFHLPLVRNVPTGRSYITPIWQLCLSTQLKQDLHIILWEVLSTLHNTNTLQIATLCKSCCAEKLCKKCYASPDCVQPHL